MAHKKMLQGGTKKKRKKERKIASGINGFLVPNFNKIATFYLY